MCCYLLGLDQRKNAWDHGTQADPNGIQLIHARSLWTRPLLVEIAGLPRKKTLLTNGGYMHHHPSHVGSSHKIYAARDMFGSPTIHALHVNGSCNMILLQILVLVVKWSIKFLHRLAKRFAFYDRSPAELSFLRFSRQLDHPNPPAGL